MIIGPAKWGEISGSRSAEREYNAHRSPTHQSHPATSTKPSQSLRVVYLQALSDVLGVKNSLHRGWQDATVFHGSFAGTVGLAAAIVLIPGVPLGLVTTGVQALAGVLLPSATIFLVLLCNDRAVLGPWTNPRWLNMVAMLVVGSLLVLSALLTLITLLPGIDVAVTAVVLAAVLAAPFGYLTATGTGKRRSQPQLFRGTPWERATWTMPPLGRIGPAMPSRGRDAVLIALRVYLALAVLSLVVQIVRLALAA